MIVDFLSPSTSQDLEVDLCIVGTGPAGIAIARSFIGSAVRVCVLESGGLDGEPDSQALYRGDSTGMLEFDPSSCRLRAFGGSGNAWGGGCIPLDAPVLAHRPWVPDSGWPLSYAELEPHYQSALAYCGIDGQSFRPGSFNAMPERPPPSVDPAKLVNRHFILSPVLFGDTYREELARAPDITVMLHANLLELEADQAAATVRTAKIGSLDGRRGVVRARNYVLACGAIENARLLLLSDAVAKGGLGNQHDLVGRYFMDHPRGKLGEIATDDADRLCRPYDRTGRKGATPTFPELCIAEEAAREHRTLAGRVRPVAVEAPSSAAIQALREFRAALRTPSRDEALEGQITSHPKHPNRPETAAQWARLARQLGSGLGDIGHAVGRKLAGQPLVRTDHVDVIGFFEQAPNRDSRISLGRDTDALGQRRVCVHWQLTPLDWHTYQTVARIAGDELARACQGRFKPEPWLEPGSDMVPPLTGTSHHLGTTRMSDDPRSGVVDRHCKVHGVDNLYVIGSSVFPAAGWAFPTFTIVALALRLGEHLRAQTSQSVADGYVNDATARPPRRPAASPLQPDPIPARTCVRVPAGPS